MTLGRRPGAGSGSPAGKAARSRGGRRFPEVGASLDYGKDSKMEELLFLSKEGEQ